MNRILYYDVLNVISCISVVCMHSNGYIHQFVKDDWWWARVMIEVLCYFAVPVFFMLSGATLMQYRQRYSTKTFYLKRFQRVFVPYFFWGGSFCLIHMFHKRTYNWYDMVNNFTTGTIPFANFWFFIPLLMIYIFIPYLSLMVLNLSKKDVLALCGLLFLFQSLLPTIYTLLGLEFKVSMPIGGYFFFVLLGYYVSVTNWEENKWLLLFFGILSLSSILIRYYLIYISDTKCGQLFTYFGLFSVIPALFVFMMIKNWMRGMKSSKDSIWFFLSQKSMGVYLIHTFLISMLTFIIDRTSFLFVPVSVVIVYSLSILIVTILQKNRYVRIIVP